MTAHQDDYGAAQSRDVEQWCLFVGYAYQGITGSPPVDRAPEAIGVSTRARPTKRPFPRTFTRGRLEGKGPNAPRDGARVIGKDHHERLPVQTQRLAARMPGSAEKGSRLPSVGRGTALRNEFKQSSHRCSHST